MDMNDPFDKTVRREEAAGLRSFSWAGRELRFCGERTTLHVAGVSYDMEPVLDALRHAGVRVRGISRPDGSPCSGDALPSFPAVTKCLSWPEPRPAGKVSRTL